MKFICIGVISAVIAFSSASENIEVNSDLNFQLHRGSPQLTFTEIFPHYHSELTQMDLNPGIYPEGDYIGELIFSNDGSYLFVSNRMTDNITVFDATTMNLIDNIEVGDYPQYMAATDSLLIVTCAFSDEVYVIGLDNFAVDTVFTLSSGIQPWTVKIHPDGNYAFVACDISNTLEIFRLDSFSHYMTVNEFPIALITYGWGSENGRNFVNFTSFDLTPDGQYILVGDWEDTLFYYNTSSGNIDSFIPGIPDCPILRISGDGSSAVAVSLTNPAVLYRIDIASFQKTDSVVLTSHTISMAYDVAVNEDGSKAFVGINGNQSALIRFNSSDFITFSSTYTPFWLGVSPDHSLAISGQYRFSIIDFNSETMLGQYQGNSMNRGAVSPVDYQAAGFDPTRHEGIYWYDYSNPSSPSYTGTTVSGEYPEGDAPRRVAITPDGNKAIITNVLSDNATIIDLQDYTVDTIINMGDRVQDVAITSNSQWALVCTFEGNSVKVIDLTNNEVVADVYTGTRAGVISISPDDQNAYVGNISANTVSILSVNGSSTYKIGDVYPGTIGVSWAAYGVSSDVEASPHGSCGLVAVSFDDSVKVIDLNSASIVASLPSGDFPLQIAFDSSGNYATVTNYFSDNVTIMEINGDSSSVVGTFGYGESPLRLAYCDYNDQMGIGHYTSKTVVMINPRTGAYLHTYDYGSYGNLIQVDFDRWGKPVVLTTSDGNNPGHLIKDSIAVVLPATPAYFAFNDSVNKAVVAMPGPDYATVIQYDPVGVQEIVNIPLNSGQLQFRTIHNLNSGEVTIRFNLDYPQYIDLNIYDEGGRNIRCLQRGWLNSGDHCFSWNIRNCQEWTICPGNYFIMFNSDQGKASAKISVIR
ncbi:MAG: hypothetical protein APR63_04015 [Desulfuromonas sp. SDB]|nr:MAG: hypothetical protein APR63_04015 [Desulfuromonas sp. SDB]